MSRRGADDASISVLETVTVGIMVFGVVLYVAGINEPTGDESGAHARVELFAQDALAVLSGLPSENGGYATLLDELVADAKDGNESDLRDQLDKYFPPGVAYNVYLNDGQEPIPLVEDYEPTGPTVTVSRLVAVTESRYFIFPSMDYTAGTRDPTLDFMVVPLKNRFFDPHATPELRFPNGYGAPISLNSSRGYLSAEDVVSENVNRPNGFATQYDKTDNTSYIASVTAASVEPAVRFRVNTSTEHPSSGHPYYEVHPFYYLDSTLFGNVSVHGDSHVEEGDRSKHRGKRFAMDYDYSDPLSKLTDAGWLITDKRVRIYSPVDGSVVFEETFSALSGRIEYSVPMDAPYGTYVVEWEFTLLKDGLTQATRDLTMFPVTASAGSSTLPPFYRVELVAWLEGV